MQKRCVVCGIEKPITEFQSSDIAMCGDGYLAYCLACAWDLYYGTGKLTGRPQLPPRLKRQQEQLDEFENRQKRKNRSRQQKWRDKQTKKSSKPPKQHVEVDEKLKRKREKQRDRSRLRRKRERELPKKWSVIDKKTTMQYWEGCCAYCGDAAQKRFDHYIPVFYEGSDNPGTVPWNMLPCCPHCNWSKNTQHPEDWLYKKYPDNAGQIIEQIQKYFEWARKRD
jgi:hypothetical protein